ncbi:alpha/beta fold hydrolase [Neobacillus niacini]|uniref:alpha/beta fold hydrolase n=1 Tax=Neobacillus niacini TaxID=86668 RepID=UPI0021CB996F|nr:alpha/beta hydrolase [Neobacillus niacini]MCM3768590.1 alpha/beta hydrolase [Neobacillus niacini]
MNVLAKTRKIPGENSIVTMEKVMIGGVKQSIMIRGENRENPVLLMVHGGPGQSEIYLSHMLNGPLEKHFTIVNWDQRGAAKSYSMDVKPEHMTLAQLLADGEEVIQYVRNKLNKPQEKFYLHGHSFGTILGVLMAKKYPEYFHAYIGTAQVVGLLDNLITSYDWTMKRAKELGNQKAITELEQIGKPPFHHFSKGLWKYSVWLAKFGGKMYNSQGTEIFKGIFSAPEYSLLDKLRFFRGSLFSVKHMHQELLQTNLKEIVASIDIPVYFFLGKHDYSAPHELAHEYFQVLQAPGKELIWFEKSGHMPQFEESSKYVEELSNIAKRQ